jgi:hypothetical protein
MRSLHEVLAERLKLLQGERHQVAAASNSAASRLDAASASGSSSRWNFGTTAEFWLNLQKTYDLRVAEREAGARIRREVKPAA